MRNVDHIAEPIGQGGQLPAYFLVLMGKPYIACPTTFCCSKMKKKYIALHTAQQQAKSLVCHRMFDVQKMHQNAFADGTLGQTPLGCLQRSPDP